MLDTASCVEALVRSAPFPPANTSHSAVCYAARAATESSRHGSHMEQETHPRIEGSHPQVARKLSQETKAILAAATSIIVLLLGLLITTLLTSARIEARIEARINQMQAEARSDRAAWQAEIRTLRAEVRADRQDFQRQILRLTEAQVRTAAVVEQMQAASR